MPGPNLDSTRIGSTPSAAPYTPGAAPGLQHFVSKDQPPSATNSSLSSQKSSSCLENCLNTIFELFKKFGDWIRELLCCCSPSDDPSKPQDGTAPAEAQITQDSRPLLLSNSPPLPVSAHVAEATPIGTTSSASPAIGFDLAVSKTEPSALSKEPCASSVSATPPTTFTENVRFHLNAWWQELCKTDLFPCSLNLAYQAKHNNEKYYSESKFHLILSNKQHLLEAHIQVSRWAKQVTDMVDTRRSTEYAVDWIHFAFFAIYTEKANDGEISVSSNATPTLCCYSSSTLEDRGFGEPRVIPFDSMKQKPLGIFNSRDYVDAHKPFTSVLGHPEGLINPDTGALVKYNPIVYRSDLPGTPDGDQTSVS